MEVLRLSDIALLSAEDDRSTLQATVDIAVQLLRVPMAKISVVDPSRKRQVFMAHHGLPKKLEEEGESCLSLSICREIRRTGEPLAINDLAADPVYQSHPAHTELGLRAYMGHPIFGPFETPFAALCVGSDTPRVWEDRDLHILSYLARQTTRYMQRKATRVLERDGLKGYHILLD